MRTAPALLMAVALSWPASALGQFWNGINIGTSREESLVAAFGQPTSREASNGSVELIYQKGQSVPGTTYASIIVGSSGVVTEILITPAMPLIFLKSPYGEAWVLDTFGDSPVKEFSDDSPPLPIWRYERSRVAVLFGADGTVGAIKFGDSQSAPYVPPTRQPAVARSCVEEVAELEDRVEKGWRMHRQMLILSPPKGQYSLRMVQMAELQLEDESRDLARKQAACNAQFRAAQEAARPAPSAGSPGCGKDTECKGNRICVAGACVAP